MSNKTDSILYKDLDKETKHYIFRTMVNGYKPKPNKLKKTNE